MFSLGAVFAVLVILGFAAASVFAMLSVVFNDEGSMQKVKVHVSRQNAGVRHSQSRFYNH